MGDWRFDVIDPTGVKRGELWQADDIRIARAVSKPTVVSFRISAEDPLIVWFAERKTKVKAYRDGVLRAFNLVDTCPDTFSEEWSGIEVVTVSPLARLGWRSLQADAVFASIDQGEITKQIIDAQNARKPTGIRTSATGAFPTTVPRTITFPRNSFALPDIRLMADSYSGFEFDAVPVDDVDGVMADFHLYTRQGEDRPSVRLQYGAGTKNNIASGKRLLDTTKLASNVHVPGRSDGATQLQADRTDATVVAAYDSIFDTVDAFSDIGQQEILDVIADELAARRQAPRELLELVVADTAEYAPWDDFDVGDRVNARIIDGRVDLDGSVRIWAFEAAVDGANGDEVLTSITIEPEAS